MKVLHVIDALGVGGGAEHSLATLLPMLRDRGVDSTIVCLIPRNGGLQEQLRSQGFDVEVLSAKSWLGRIRALRAKIHAESPDIVHATLLNSCLVTRFACVGLGVRQINSLVNTSYDPVRLSELNIPHWKLSTVRAVDGFTARHLGDRFHVITDAVLQEATGVLGIDPARITVIPRGRATDALGERTETRQRATRELLEIDDTVPVLLNIGRQDGQKAQADLIRAFALTLEAHPEAVLLIAGREGDASHEVARALAETGISESVHLLGHRGDVPDLLSMADVFVFPSRYEGLGCSLIEAMALGAPIIGSDAAAISEVLGDGRYGLVTPRGDIDALSKAITNLLSDPQRRVELSERGRKQFLEQYELGRIADLTVAMYDETIALGK